MTTPAPPYESAITAEEYRTLVDCKYRGNITGWALVDEHSGIRGWHQQIPGNPTWSDRHSAMRGLIPDSSRQPKNQRTDKGNAQAKNAAVTISIIKRKAFLLPNWRAVGRPSRAPIR